MSKATAKLSSIQEVVKSVAAGGADELLSLACAPPLTWNVLKALLLVMGKTADQMDTWLKCRSAALDALCCATHHCACLSCVHVACPGYAAHVVHICLLSVLVTLLLSA